MCRNIRTLFNFEPPSTEDEIRASALQFVRKIGGFAIPSAANGKEFYHAVDQDAQVSSRLLDLLVTTASPRNRKVETVKARVRAARGLGS